MKDLHCECPLNGEPCCACGKIDCPVPASEARRHEVELRAEGRWPGKD